MMVKDFDAWAFERKMKLDGTLPVWLKDEPSEAMQFGTAVHMALLEPKEFERRAVIMPYVESFALKAGKDIKTKAVDHAEAIGGFVLRQEHAWAISQIRNNWQEMTQQNASVFSGDWQTEKQIITNDLKGTIDLLTPDWLIDLKTAREIHKARDVMVWERYHVQLAHYQRLEHRERCGFVFIENQAPFRCEFIEVSKELMELGEGARAIAMRKAEEKGLLWGLKEGVFASTRNIAQGWFHG